MIPILRAWLGALPTEPAVFIEPFAGGASASLTATFESFCTRALLSDLDSSVAVVWQSALCEAGETLAENVESFRLTRKNVKELFRRAEVGSQFEKALAVIVRNRIQRAGVLATGAGILKHGENGKGIQSRWYPKTIATRLREITKSRTKLSFLHCDGFEVLEEYVDDENAVAFVDPPYFGPASRLYNHWKLDHEGLFQLLGRFKGDFLLAYDNASEIRELASKYEFDVALVAMKTSHHKKKNELLIGRNLGWVDQLLPKSGQAKAPSVQRRTLAKTSFGKRPTA